MAGEAALDLINRQEWLDPLGDQVQKGVTKPSSRLERRAKTSRMRCTEPGLAIPCILF